eukprot:symbB.v1.2.035524.t1/scaffold4805.1/size34556/2
MFLKTWQKPLLIIFFGPILVIVSVGLMNLITAVLVESSLEQAQHEAESERLQLKKRIKEALPRLLQTFTELDTDGSGSLTLEEVQGVPIEILPAKMLETMSVDSMPELFELLDVDCSGQLDQREFIDGLLNLVLLDVPISTIQSLRLLRLLRTMVSKLDSDVQALHASVSASNGGPVRPYVHALSRERSFKHHTLLAETKHTRNKAKDELLDKELP